MVAPLLIKFGGLVVSSNERTADSMQPEEAERTSVRLRHGQYRHSHVLTVASCVAWSTLFPCACVRSRAQVKTLTKPLANQIKSHASHPGPLRTAFLRYGRFHHNLESRAVLRLAGLEAKSVKPVSEEVAVGIGATVFSEVFIFTTAGAVLFFELWKKAQDDDAAKVKKDAVAAQERRDLESRFRAIEHELGTTAAALRDTQLELQTLRLDREAHEAVATAPKRWY